MKGYVFVAIGAWIISLTYGVRFAFGQFLPTIQSEFQLDHQHTTYLASSIYAGTCMALLVAAYLTERFGPRMTVAIAMVFGTLGAAAVGFATTPTGLIVSLSLIGISSGLSMPPLVAGVTVSCACYRDRAVSVINAGTGIGIVAASLTALYFADSWRECFLVFALISILISIAAFFVVPGQTKAVNVNASFKTVIRSPALHQAISSSLLFGIVSAAIWTGGGISLVGLADWNSTGVSLFWIALGVAGLLGAFCGDFISRLDLAEVHSISFVGLGTSALLLAMARHSEMVGLVAASLFGVFYMTGTGLYLIWAARISTDHAPSVVAMLFFMLPVGQIVGSTIYGHLANLFEVDHVLIIFALMSSCYIVIQFFAKIDGDTRSSLQDTRETGAVISSQVISGPERSQ
ncbi:MFS transporter [uncultured Roseibium sp.]|uniref:MFS transporter n=1 Tax=uncultured Roseibium sp. TaxID=1936171 RepID=UPI002639A7E1|nr:MFS transporter [uncultured Roseibium sp.]